MSFNPNIPLVTDFILQSFNQLRSNFQAIDSAFSNNHLSMSGDATMAGQHRALTLRPQGGDPVTGADQAAIFTKLVSGAPNLFFAPNNSQTPIQLTNPSLLTTGLTQHTFLAGPFIVYAGFISNPTQNQLVTLTPGTTLIYVDLTITAYSKAIQDKPATAAPTNVVGTSFNITLSNNILASPAATFGIYYLAIGLP